MEESFENKIKDKIFLLELDISDYKQLAKFTNINKKIIYITINSPYSKLINELKKNGINTSDITFIDCISKKINFTRKNDSCIYIKAPNSLTELSIVLMDKLKTKEYETVIFDSISALLIYNSKELTIMFLRNIIDKINYYKLDCFLLLIKNKESQDFKEKILKFYK